MKALRLLPLLLLFLPASGCRNPFNPAAKVRFERFYAGSTFEYFLSINQGTANTLITGTGSFANVEAIATRAQFVNSSTVPAFITGYSVVYRQVATGLPIPECGGAVGRRFQVHFPVIELASNASAPLGQVFNVQIVTSELVTFIANNLDTTSGGIDCEVTFYGEDDNGYDIKLDASLHIDVF